MRGRRWSASEERRLRSLYPGSSQKEVATLLGRSHKSIASRAKLLRLRRIRNYKVWTPQDRKRLRELYADRPTAEVARIFKRSVSSVLAEAAKLGLKKSAGYLRACLAECGRRTSSHPRSIAARIQKGNVPANKGLRRPGWFRGRMRETQFKRGQLNGRAAQLYKPIGALVTDPDGYLIRKVRETGHGRQRWEFEHVLIWRAEHGPVQAGHAVVFKDGNKKHIAIENLECITRAELMRRNSIHRRRSPELKEATYALIALKSQITKKEKKRGQKQVKQSAGSPIRDARSA